MTTIGKPGLTDEMIDKRNGLFNHVNCHGLRRKSLPKRETNILTVVGSAKCVLDDIESYGIHGDLMVINHAGFYYPKDRPYQHLVSLHCDHFRINDIVRRHMRPQEKFHNYYTHSYGSIGNKMVREKDFIDFVWNFRPEPKSSGILGCFIGMALGYTKIILLGIPLDLSVRFFDLGVDPSREQSYYNNMYINLLHDRVFHIMKPFVRSSSGNTKVVLGEPTKEWIYG